MTDKKPAKTENADRIVTEAFKYEEANRLKNVYNNQERKAASELEKMFSNAKPGELRTVDISDQLSLEIGYVTENTEEIDPKKLLELDPNYFWDNVSFSMTNVINKFGEKTAANISRPVPKTKFKIVKIKSKKK